MINRLFIKIWFVFTLLGDVLRGSTGPGLFEIMDIVIKTVNETLEITSDSKFPEEEQLEGYCKETLINYFSDKNMTVKNHVLNLAIELAVARLKK